MRLWRLASIAALVSVTVIGGAQARQASGLANLLEVKGKCERLSLDVADATAKCDSTIANATYQNGRSGFVFTGGGDRVIVTFSGVGSAAIVAGADTRVQPLDFVMVSFVGSAPHSLKAVGQCRYANPYAGAAVIDCTATTEKGVFEGRFRTDGTQPQVKQLRP